MSDAGIKYILATQPQFLVPSRNQAIQMSHMLSADLNTSNVYLNWSQL